MKIVAVGDIHGRQTWKEVYEKEKDCDKFVFIGDYFDNFPPMTQEQIHENFKEILALKRAHPEQVVLLIGNHEFHYMSFANGHFSGFNKEWAGRHGELLNEAFIVYGEMQACFIAGNVLFSHAGVTKTWAKLAEIDLSPEKLQDSINKKLKTDPQWFNFIIGGDCDPSGDDKHQGCMWVRPNSLRDDMIDGYIQVVGHTGFKQVSAFQDAEKQIIFLDAPKVKEYLIIEDGVAQIGSLENGKEKA